MRPEAVDVDVAVFGTMLGTAVAEVGAGADVRLACVELPSSRVAPKALSAPVNAKNVAAQYNPREDHFFAESEISFWSMRG